MFTLMIGADVAGLSAARGLHDAGQTVTVLEAFDRRFLAEFGPESIHGDLAPT
jgi:2-polyprenyl-6-methoxyphenol hydroxylase-like FAD-dependent oxidoreductase